MGFSVMLWGARKLVPAEYWCPYGTQILGYGTQMAKDLVQVCKILCLETS